MEVYPKSKIFQFQSISNPFWTHFGPHENMKNHRPRHCDKFPGFSVPGVAVAGRSTRFTINFRTGYLRLRPSWPSLNSCTRPALRVFDADRFIVRFRQVSSCCAVLMSLRGFGDANHPSEGKRFSLLTNADSIWTCPVIHSGFAATQWARSEYPIST